MSQEEEEQKQRFYFNWSLTLKTKSCHTFFSEADDFLGTVLNSGVVHVGLKKSL